MFIVSVLEVEVLWAGTKPGVDHIVDFLQSRALCIAETALPGAGVFSHYLLYEDQRNMKAVKMGGILQTEHFTFPWGCNVSKMKVHLGTIQASEI